MSNGVVWQADNARGRTAVLSLDGRLPFELSPTGEERIGVPIVDPVTSRPVVSIDVPKASSGRLGSFSPDGRWLVLFESGNHFDNLVLMRHSNVGVAANTQMEITVWNVSTGKPQFDLTTRAALDRLTISPDGRYLALCLRDGTVDLWDLESGCELFTWQSHVTSRASDPQRDVRHLAFSGPGPSILMVDVEHHRLRCLDLGELRKQLETIGLGW